MNTLLLSIAALFCISTVVSSDQSMIDKAKKEASGALDQAKKTLEEQKEKLGEYKRKFKSTFEGKTTTFSEEAKKKIGDRMAKIKEKLSEADKTELDRIESKMKEKPEEASKEIDSLKTRIKLIDVKEMTSEQKEVMESMRESVYKGLEKVESGGKIPADKKPNLKEDFLESLIRNPKDKQIKVSMEERKEKMKQEGKIWLSQLGASKTQLRTKVGNKVRLALRMEQSDVAGEKVIDISGDGTGPKLKLPKNPEWLKEGADWCMGVTPLEELTEEDKKDLLGPIVRIEAYAKDSINLMEVEDLPEPVVLEMPLDKATCEKGKAAYMSSTDEGTKWTVDDTCTLKYEGNACQIVTKHLTDFTTVDSQSSWAIQKDSASGLFASSLLIAAGTVLAMMWL